MAGSGDVGLVTDQISAARAMGATLVLPRALSALHAARRLKTVVVSSPARLRRYFQEISLRLLSRRDNYRWKMDHSSPFRRGLELRRAEIHRLPLDLKAALAAACTQRQMEVYRTYARRTGTSAAVSFNRLLDAIWNKIRCGQSLEREEHLEWENRAEGLYPGDEATPDIYKGCAQIAVLSLLHSNNILWTKKADDACSAAHEAFSSIFNFLTNPMGPQRQIDLHQPGALEQAFAHSLIEAEHLRQQRDLGEVEQALLRPSITGTVVDELRRRSVIEAKDFLPIIEGPPRR